MTRLFTLTESDVAVLQRLLDQVKKDRVNTPSRPGIEEQDFLASEIHIAKPQEAGGIPAATIVAGTGTGDDEAGSGLCDIHRIIDDGTGALEIQEVANLEKLVHNISNAVIPQDWFIAAKSKYGKWLAIVAPQGFQLVEVEWDGGVAGDASTTCTFTYTVRDLDGNELDTNVSPETARLSNTEYLAAGATGTGTGTGGGRSAYAIAYNLSGTWLLLDVPGERPDNEACT